MYICVCCSADNVQTRAFDGGPWSEDDLCARHAHTQEEGHSNVRTWYTCVDMQAHALTHRHP